MPVVSRIADIEQADVIPISTTAPPASPAQVPSTESRSPRRIGEEPESDRASKRQRTVETAQSSQTEDLPEPLSVTEPIAGQLPTPSTAPTTAPTVQTSLPVDPALEDTGGDSIQEVDAAQADSDRNVQQEQAAEVSRATSTQGPPKPTRQRKGRASWKAVNQGQGGEETVAEPSINAPAAPKPRVRRRATRATQEETTRERDDSAAQAAALLNRARSQTTDAPADSGSTEWTPTAPPKKPRKPRKDRGQKRKSPAEEGTEGNVAGEAGIAEAERPAKKKRAPRKKKTTAATKPNGEVIEGQEQETQGRGRERSATPEDAEHQIVENDTTVLNALASRHHRIGRMSQREKQMREVNWDEVKEQRQKENALEVPRLKTQQEKAAEEEARVAAENQEQLQRQAPAQRARLVNGRMVIDSGRTAADEDDEDDEDADVVDGDVHEVHDLTRRVTTHSFLRENKRTPKQFMLPGQVKRWTVEMNERFYDALQIFGTDFGSMQTLFKDVTRRSLKLKFNREEKENPDLIKAALNGQRKSNWEEFLGKSGYTDAHFIDPRALEAELEGMREEARPEIEKKKAEAEEIKRQRVLAGLPPEEEDEQQPEQEGGKKGRKKREKRTVQWQDDENVEIVGDVGDEDDYDE